MGGFGREIPRFGNIPGKNCESITVARPPTPSCRAVCLPVRHCPNLGNRRLPALEARAACRRGAAETRRSGLQKTAGMAIPPDRERGIPWSAGPPSQMPGGLPQAHGQARGAHGREKAPRAALPVPLRAKTDRGKRSDRYEHHDQRFPRGSGGLPAAGACRRCGRPWCPILP